MYKYEIITYWSEEDKKYIAEVPELPGRMADGDTYEEVMKMFKSLFLNGWKLQRAWGVQSQNQKEGLCIRDLKRRVRVLPLNSVADFPCPNRLALGKAFSVRT